MLGTSNEIRNPGLRALPPGVERYFVKGGGLYSNYNLPFGGINNSGFGRCHGEYGFRELSNKKSIFKQFSPFSPTDLLTPPYNSFKQKIIDIIIKYL